MRLLIWHVDSFTAEPTERGRSKLADREPQPVSIGEGVVVFAAVEKKDEPEPLAVAARAAPAIAEVARNLGAKAVLLHSFAHLFVELSVPSIARETLNETQRLLEEEGFTVSQSAFGWFNRLEMRAKGHPLSRVARQV
jgi:threonyl-tRNA synthetase